MKKASSGLQIYTKETKSDVIQKIVFLCPTDEGLINGKYARPSPQLARLSADRNYIDHFTLNESKKVLACICATLAPSTCGLPSVLSI